VAVDINKELTFIRQIPDIGNWLGDALERIVKGVNITGSHIGVDPTGTLPPPPAPQQVNVKTNGAGLVHVTIDDHNEIAKNLHYFVEYANEPSFLQPQVEHLGVSRQMRPTTLPAMDDNGNPQKWYFRAFSAYPGSKQPSARVNHGGTVPTAIDPGGTHQMTLLPSTGSGTAQNSGQEGGSGFGKIQIRPATATRKTA
jgi:hypothetical protein